MIVFANQKTVNKLNGFKDTQVSGLEISLYDFNKLYESSLKIGKKVAYNNIDNNTQ